MKNSCQITQTAATVAALMHLPPWNDAAPMNKIVFEMGNDVFSCVPVDRVLLYNPDAIAMWLFQKYTDLFLPVLKHTQLSIPVESVMPSVTPVCFASMYTGMVPEKHGIQAYVKPVLQVKTLFDALIEAGKKPIIISTEGDSVSKIFLERKMDYHICATADECNAVALEVMEQDQYDLVVVYNGNYDTLMHRWGPEAEETLMQLRHNADAFDTLCRKASEIWKDKRYMTAFLTDHGCHEIDGNLGSHGLDMPEDMNIVHFFGFHSPV